jgi:hypothetical protein
MKKFIPIIFTFLAICPLTILSQESLKKVRLYNTRITTMTIVKYNYEYGTTPTPVYVKIKHIYTVDINKEEITVVAKEYAAQSKVLNEAELEHIAVSNIQKISFGREGDWLKGALIGSSVIFVAGFIVGCILYDPEVTWAVPGGVIGLAVGAGSIPLGFAIGSAIGSKRSRYEINGDQAEFDKVRPELEKYSIKYYYD